MRIALVCTEKLPVPPVRGGAIQTYIDGVLPYLAARHEVTVVGRTDPDLPDREVRGAVQYLRVPAEGGPEAYARRAAAALERRRWDALLLYNRPAFLEHYAEAAPGARLLLSLHNAMLNTDRLPPDQTRQILARVDRVLCISDFIREGVLRVAPEAAPRVRTIRSGVDLLRFRPGPHPEEAALRARHELGDRPVLLSVGRLSPKKGIHLVLAAMERVRLTHPQAVLLHVGSRWYGREDEDDYVRAIRRQAEGLGDAVRLAGYVPYAEIDGYFGLASVFICASQWEEPLARVHYEAMAAGLPIITTDRGGYGEVVRDGENGLIIRPHDRVEAFAAAMQSLLDDSGLRRRLGEHGRRLAEREYGWERVARQLLAAVEE
jgi:spore coat protein SA